MLNTIRTALTRAEAHLVQDMIGAVSLCVILVAGLHLPLL